MDIDGVIGAESRTAKTAQNLYSNPSLFPIVLMMDVVLCGNCFTIYYYLKFIKNAPFGVKLGQKKEVPRRRGLADDRGELSGDYEPSTPSPVHICRYILKMSDKVTLPRNCKPSHYKLSLRDLDFQSWTYKGTARQVNWALN